MEQTHSYSTATGCAAILLDAWESGDIASFRCHLDATLQARSIADLCELERERGELVSGIAESLRDALTKNSDIPAVCDIEIPLELLKHVAFGGGH
jgi:hypothetical protein